MKKTTTKKKSTVEIVREVRIELMNECLKEAKGNKKLAYEIYQRKCKFP